MAANFSLNQVTVILGDNNTIQLVRIFTPREVSSTATVAIHAQQYVFTFSADIGNCWPVYGELVSIKGKRSLKQPCS